MESAPTVGTLKAFGDRQHPEKRVMITVVTAMRTDETSAEVGNVSISESSCGSAMTAKEKSRNTQCKKRLESPKLLSPQKYKKPLSIFAAAAVNGARRQVALWCIVKALFLFG
jgi:hypothetical protein